MRTLINTIVAALAPAAAFAASGAHEDNSGIFSTIFLGLCALIVVGQLVPAAMMMLGIARGVRKEAKTEAA
jgi:hypothetical protein